MIYEFKRLVAKGIVLCVGLSASSMAQQEELPSEAEVLAGVKADLVESSKRLSEQRADLGMEVYKKAHALELAEAVLIDARRRQKLALMSAADRKQQLNRLQLKQFKLVEEVTLLSGLFKSYGLQLQTQLNPGESYDEKLKGVFGTDPNKAEQLQNRFSAIEAGMDRLEMMLGGAIVEGEATDTDSVIVRGKVAIVGPFKWFQSSDGKVSGSLKLSKNGQIAQLDSSDAEQASKIFSGQLADATIDLTGGKAKALASIDNSLLGLVKKGGAWVYPILLLALIALVCAMIKFVQLLKVKSPSVHFVSQFLEMDSELAQAQHLAKVSHPIAGVLPHCLDASAAGASVVEEVLYERLIDVRDHLRRWLPFIAITAATAPLLGLLGTVSGLIRTFNIITVEGTGEAQSFAGGISEALITTMFGLIVAIPAFILHALLSRRAKGIEQTTEKLGLGYVNGLRKLGKK